MTTTTEAAADTTRDGQPVHPRDLTHGELVTATNPRTGHAITGRWNKNRAYIEIDHAERNGYHHVPLALLDGFTFTQH